MGIALNAAREQVSEGREGSGLRAQKLQERAAAARLPGWCDAILLCLLSHEGQFRGADGRLELLAWPSLPLLMHRTRLSKPTVIKGLRWLEHAGIVRASWAPEGHKLYALVCTKADASPRRALGAVPAAEVPKQPRRVSGVDPSPVPGGINAVNLRGSMALTGGVNGVDPNDSGNNPKKYPRNCPARSAGQGSGGVGQSPAEHRAPVQVHLPTVAANHVDVPPALEPTEAREGLPVLAQGARPSAPSDPTGCPEHATLALAGEPSDTAPRALAPRHAPPGESVTRDAHTPASDAPATRQRRVSGTASDEAPAPVPVLPSGDQVVPAGEPKGPPPFSVLDALQTLATASDGRVIVGDPAEWATGYLVAVRRQIRKVPDLARWRLVGEYLATGRRDWKATGLTLAWAGSNDFLAALIEADDWHRKGRPETGTIRAKRAPVRSAAYAGREHSTVSNRPSPEKKAPCLPVRPPAIPDNAPAWLREGYARCITKIAKRDGTAPPAPVVSAPARPLVGQGRLSGTLVAPAPLAQDPEALLGQDDPLADPTPHLPPLSQSPALATIWSAARQRMEANPATGPTHALAAVPAPDPTPRE